MPVKSKPFIKVVSWRANNLKSIQGEADFYLETDSWNDYNYYTSYHLHADGHFFSEGETSLIGSLRILRRGQTTGSQYQLENGPFEKLGEEYCSMPNSLDYYERLSHLPKAIRDSILIALRDLVIYPEIKKEFKEEEG